MLRILWESLWIEIITLTFKIKNLEPPAEGTDAINQTYLSMQINHTQDVLKSGISKEVISIRSDIEELRHTIKDIFDVIKEISSAIYGKTSNNS